MAILQLNDGETKNDIVSSSTHGNGREKAAKPYVQQPGGSSTHGNGREKATKPYVQHLDGSYVHRHYLPSAMRDPFWW